MLALPMMCPTLLPGQSSWKTTSWAAAHRLLACPFETCDDVACYFPRSQLPTHATAWAVLPIYGSLCVGS